MMLVCSVLPVPGMTEPSRLVGLVSKMLFLATQGQHVPINVKFGRRKLYRNVRLLPTKASEVGIYAHKFAPEWRSVCRISIKSHYVCAQAFVVLIWLLSVDITCQVKR